MLAGRAPPPPPGGAPRLYLPGVECAYQLVSGVLPGATTTAPTNGFLQPQSPPSPPRPTAPTAPTTPSGPDVSEPVDTTPVETTVTPPVLKALPSGTTIAPDNLDPLAPVPSVAASAIVGRCGGNPAASATG